MTYNKLLIRQIQKQLGHENKIPENLIPLFQVISDSYDHHEKDRRMLERSIDLSSNEMVELNTNLRKEKDDLKKAHQELNGLFENINEVIFSVDVVLNKLSKISVVCEKIYGYTSAEFMADPELWRKIIHPDDQHIAAQQLKSLHEGSQVLNQYRIIHKDQSIRWVENRVFPTLDETGRLIRIDGVTSDITERKKSEEKLVVSEVRLREIIDLVPHFIFAKDIEGKFILANKATADVYGTTINQLVGKTDADFNPNIEEVSHFINTDKKVIESGLEILNQEETVTDSQGNIRVLSTTKIPFTASGTDIPAVLGVSVDISERKFSEIRMKELNEKLEQHARHLADSNSELEQFAYVASHDLQEPLRMVTSFLTQLERKYVDIIDDKGKQYIHFAVDGAKRMRQIILDLLEYSRVGRSNESIELIDVNDLCRDIILLHQRQIADSEAVIRLENLPVLSSYKAPLQQLLQNLLSNALKYQKPDARPVVTISCSETPCNWQFAVKDNGIGIHPDYFEKIFTIFQRLHNKDEYSGTGMGLAICKKIVENMGGKIWLESVEGKGTTFHFSLPKNIVEKS
jgi:PAS domain S-box-containing protein